MCIVSALIGFSAFSQDSETAADTLRKDALNVYMSASDYIRREIPYINYVRDIKDADVYIISTSQSTGSGGREYTYFISGQHDFAGMEDTVSYTITPDETSEGMRQKQVATLKMGLMRYVAKTPLSQYINIRFTEPLTETVSEDKWNSWVFESSLSTYLNGQKSTKYRNISGRFSADRITEDWKIETGLSYNYSVNKYEIGDDIITSDYNSKWANALVVKSLTDHWSYGGSVRVGAATYNNLDFQLYAMPGIEYDIFPYAESTKRQFMLFYRAGYGYVDYHDTTIYNKTEEHLWLHRFSAGYELTQKWGYLRFSFSYSNYFHDWSKNNLDLYGSLSLRIVKGLSVNLYGNYSIIHDQLGLVKGGASRDDILLQIQELETQYSYYMSFGFSYTFGSIYNNVVNPRIDSGF